MLIGSPPVARFTDIDLPHTLNGVQMVYLTVASLVLLGVVIVGAIYAMSGQPPHRRRIIQRVVLLAMAAVFVANSITSPTHRWYYVAVAAFTVGVVAFEVVWDQQRYRA